MTSYFARDKDAQTNAARKCKAILGPAVRKLRACTAGKKAYDQVRLNLSQAAPPVLTLAGLCSKSQQPLKCAKLPRLGNFKLAHFSGCYRCTRVSWWNYATDVGPSVYHQLLVITEYLV